MASRHSARMFLGSGLVTALYLAAHAAAAPQAAPAPLRTDNARVTIAGTSNIHDFTATTTTVRVTRAQVSSSVAGQTFWEDIVKPGAIEGFEIAIPAATLSSPKEGLDKNMHKALKVKEHPDITFKLLRLEPGAAGALNAHGVLRIAGVEREVTLPIQVQKQESGLAVKGELQILMTDYGIKPPTAMLGMLKTDPKAKVTFETVLAISAT